MERLRTITNNQFTQTLINNYDNESLMRDEIMNLINIIIGDQAYTEFNDNFECDTTFSINNVLLKLNDQIGNKYKLQVEGYLNPMDGEIDNITVSLIKGNKVIAEGFIEVGYGYISMNDDGNVGDGAEEYIYIEVEDVLDKLIEVKENIVSDIDSRIHRLNQLVRLCQ